MKTVEIRGARVLLTPFLKSETSTVLEWRNSEHYSRFCSTRDTVVTLEEFEKELQHDFSNDRHHQYIIRRMSDRLPIGTIFSYKYNKRDGNVFVTTYIVEKFQKLSYGAEAHALFIHYLFSKFNLHKIYVEVYLNNSSSLGPIIKAGYQEEGLFKEHRKDGEGSWQDLKRFAFYRDDIEKLQIFVNRLQHTIIP